MFVLNARHVLGICDLLIERDYGLNIWAYARVDTVKEGMLDKLKRAGFNWLALGIEAADERVLIAVDKRYRVSEIHETVRRVKDGRHQHHRQLHLRPARGQRRHDAADARSGARAELRVRELLLGDGVSGLAALRAGAGRSAGRCPRNGAATRSTPSTRCRCRRATSPRARCFGSAIARSTPISPTSRTWRWSARSSATPPSSTSVR